MTTVVSDYDDEEYSLEDLKRDVAYLGRRASQHDDEIGFLIGRVQELESELEDRIGALE